MSIAEQAALSIEEFLQLPETKPATELWNGYARQKPMPTTKHSVIQGELVESLNAIAKSSKPRTGRALPELRCTFGGRSIVPDILYVRRERLPREQNGELADRFLTASDLIVEIVSPDQSQFELVEKLAWCIQNGVQLGWLIDPDGKEIMEFVPNSIPRVLPKDGVLEGREVLPGFHCAVPEVFAWLTERS